MTSLVTAFLSKSVTVLTAATLIMGFSFNANAGFLDSIYDVQNTISSIGRTADTIRGSKQAVSSLGEEVGFTEQFYQNNSGKLVSGSVLSGKLQNTKLHSQSNKDSSPVAILSQQDVMIYMGTERNGYYLVQSDKGEGWVSKPLVSIQY